MGEPCSCEEAMALRAEALELRRQVKWLEDRNSADGTDGIIAQVDALVVERDALRELARELVAWISTPIPLADYLAQTEDNRLALLAKAKALGVEVGR